MDTNRNLRLSDLDRKIKIKENIVVLTESFGRLLNQKDGVDADTYNKSDVRTEIFVIGSVYYTLLRGYESYKTES